MIKNDEKNQLQLRIKSQQKDWVLPQLLELTTFKTFGGPSSMQEDASGVFDS